MLFRSNGYHELTDAEELRQRFEQDCQLRQQRGQPAVQIDKQLLAAQAHGLPNCAGVALGVDRLLMLKLNLPSVAATMPFADDRA